MSVLTLSSMFLRPRAVLVPLLLSLFGVTGCSLSDLVGDTSVPTGTSDPTVIETSQGALGTYYGTLHLLNQTGNDFISYSGLFTDELRPSVISSTIGYTGVLQIRIDSRYENATFQNDGTELFSDLHRVRNNARQSRGALLAYAPNVSRAIIGHTYAVEGFAEVFLADLYCSGIPLSTVDYGADVTLKPGSTTQEVYRHAIVLFDSALALSTDSLRVTNFARLGKARALLALGDYAGAQQASAEVATDFKYELTYRNIANTTPNALNELRNSFQYRTTSSSRGYTGGFGLSGGVTVSDREGVDTSRIRGIPYGSRKDPRAPIRQLQNAGAFGAPYPVYITTKYDSTGATPIVIASGIEARLIQAEAELAQGSSQWLGTLNALRTTCTTLATCPATAPAGSGKIPGLPPLSDPGTPRARLALLFEERAFWLFLTGHRQGDMRRLVREYGWEVDEVYPTGLYYRRNGGGTYGAAVNLPTPQTELTDNPEYDGCSHRRA